MLKIIIVPAMQTDLSRGGELLGINNPPLNNSGNSRADVLSSEYRDTVLEAVFSGPLKRQVETAKRIASSHSLPVRIDKNLIDLNFGSWSGKNWKDIEKVDSKSFEKMKRSPRKFRFPLGERMKRGWKRYQTFCRGLLGNFGTGTVMIVADEFVSMMLTSIITGIDFIELEPWKPSGGSTTEIDYEDGKVAIRKLRGVSRS